MSRIIAPGALAVPGFGLGSGIPVRGRPHGGALVDLARTGDVLLVVARRGRSTSLVVGPGGLLGWCALLEWEVVA